MRPRPRLEDCMNQAMTEHGLAVGYSSFVLQYLGREDNNWRRCCSSSCDPCMMQLARVVDRTRELFHGPAPSRPETLSDLPRDS